MPPAYDTHPALSDWTRGLTDSLLDVDFGATLCRLAKIPQNVKWESGGSFSGDAFYHSEDRIWDEPVLLRAPNPRREQGNSLCGFGLNPNRSRMWAAEPALLLIRC